MGSESLDSEIAGVLRRYLALQAQENALKEEKAALQEKLAGYMNKLGQRLWTPELDGQQVKVRCSESVVVEYDELILRGRLGERYKAILEPDMKKIKRNLAELGRVLEPLLDIVGSPSPAKVRAAIEQKIVQPNEFAGAFTKSVKRLIGVGKVRQEGSGKAARERL